MSIELDNKLKNYVLLLADKAQEEAEVFPVDRNFLEQHLDEIKSFDSLSFLYYNFEMANDTYANQLFVCLPELWKNIALDDLIEISKRFTNAHSYFTLIKFTYKYIEIDIIEIVLRIVQKKNTSFFYEVIEYLQNQWNVLVKSESEVEDFEEGFINVDYGEWKYIKQLFLIDKRIKPAMLSLREVKSYVARLIKDKT